VHVLDRDVTISVADPDRASVSVAGEVDASNAEDVCVALLRAARRFRCPLEVDLAGVTFMDSSGLRALTDVAGVLGASGRGLVWCNVPRQVRRLMRLAETTAMVGR
jgi:anti-anti-sigma factor